MKWEPLTQKIRPSRYMADETVRMIRRIHFIMKHRSVSINHWGSELGLAVLKGLSRLYTSLVWESTVLLALCSEDTLPPGCEFGKADMAKLLPPNFQQPATSGKSLTSLLDDHALRFDNFKNTLVYSQFRPQRGFDEEMRICFIIVLLAWQQYIQ